MLLYFNDEMHAALYFYKVGPERGLSAQYHICRNNPRKNNKALVIKLSFYNEYKSYLRSH